MIYGKRIKIVTFSLLSVIVLGVGIAFLAYSSYSSLAESDRAMVKAYKQYESVLKPQRDLLPDLVEIVRHTTLMDYPEYGELEMLVRKIDGASHISDGVSVQNRYAFMLDRVISVADSYPQLRAGQEYAMVLEQFQRCEYRASVERQRYNEAAEEFNRRLRSFPGNLVSQVFDVSDRSLLNAPGHLRHSSQPITG